MQFTCRWRWKRANCLFYPSWFSQNSEAFCSGFLASYRWYCHMEWSKINFKLGFQIVTGKESVSSSDLPDQQLTLKAWTMVVPKWRCLYLSLDTRISSTRWKENLLIVSTVNSQWVNTWGGRSALPWTVELLPDVLNSTCVFLPFTVFGHRCRHEHGVEQQADGSAGEEGSGDLHKNWKSVRRRTSNVRPSLWGDRFTGFTREWSRSRVLFFSSYRQNL